MTIRITDVLHTHPVLMLPIPFSLTCGFFCMHRLRIAMSNEKPQQLISSDQAITSPCQHTNPCTDCPWARAALHGWLGGVSIEEWLQRAHSETLVPCHVISNQQCAGLAIYRRNVMRLPRPPLLVLKPDHEQVFSTPTEFTKHHNKIEIPGLKRKCV